MSRNSCWGIGATLLAAWALAACSSTATLPADQVAREITQQLAAQFGVEADQIPEVTCPGELVGVVDTTMTCLLTDGVDVYDVDVTVTAVEGTNVKFSILVAEEPN
jgi:hypothetical protein